MFVQNLPYKLLSIYACEIFFFSYANYLTISKLGFHSANVGRPGATDFEDRPCVLVVVVGGTPPSLDGWGRCACRRCGGARRRGCHKRCWYGLRRSLTTGRLLGTDPRAGRPGLTRTIRHVRGGGTTLTPRPRLTRTSGGRVLLSVLVVGRRRRHGGCIGRFPEGNHAPNVLFVGSVDPDQPAHGISLIRTVESLRVDVGGLVLGWNVAQFVAAGVKLLLEPRHGHAMRTK